VYFVFTLTHAQDLCRSRKTLARHFFPEYPLPRGARRGPVAPGLFIVANGAPAVSQGRENPKSSRNRRANAPKNQRLFFFAESVPAGTPLADFNHRAFARSRKKVIGG